MVRFFLGLVGCLGCLSSVLLPFARYETASYELAFDEKTRSTAHDYGSVVLLGYAPVLAALVGIAAIQTLLFLLRNEDAYFRRGSQVLCLLALGSIVYGLYDFAMQDYVTWVYNVIPYYVGSGGGHAVRFGWLVLIAGSVCCFMASRLPQDANQPLALVTQHLQNLRNSVPSTAQSSTASVATAALPHDVGECAQCGVRNSKQATRCHQCAATLPWRLPKASVKPNVPAPLAAFNPVEILKFGVLHILTFAFCSSMPLLGIFLWKYMSNENSRYATTALVSSIIGFSWSLLLFLSRVLTIVNRTHS